MKTKTPIDQLTPTRLMAAAFLRGMIDQVEEILKEPDTGFQFARYVSRTNDKVRDIAGWLPRIVPELVVFEGEFLRAKHLRNSVFQPRQIGIPISNKVWQSLNVHLTQEQIGEENLQRQATFEQVKKVWLSVAARYESGELDSELVLG